MKKSLLALALAATTMGAQAANVNIYGVIDAGLAYRKFSTEGVANAQDNDAFGMGSGINAASRLGLKGSEDLGNGMKVSFKLENGFKTDTGEFKTSDTLFDREASLTLSGAFGDISFGRMGGLTSSAGTYDVFALYTDAFDGGDNNVVSGFAMSGRYNNMISYASPEFAGAKVYAQYSFQTGTDSDKDGKNVVAEQDQVSNNTRYASLGATYDVGNLGFVAVVESFQYSNLEQTANGYTYYLPKDDGLTFNFGANYDCGFAKTFAGFQIARNVTSLANVTSETTLNGIDGWAATVGTQFPVGTGNITTALYYANAEEADAEANVAKEEVKYYGLSARYVYPLSNRTSLYAGAGWAKTKFEVPGNSDEDYKITQAYAGMTHSF